MFRTSPRGNGAASRNKSTAPLSKTGLSGSVRVWMSLSPSEPLSFRVTYRTQKMDPSAFKRNLCLNLLAGWTWKLLLCSWRAKEDLHWHWSQRSCDGQFGHWSGNCTERLRDCPPAESSSSDGKRSAPLALNRNLNSNVAAALTGENSSTNSHLFL